jgi:membrane protease YdiL (CAAX protease family)
MQDHLENVNSMNATRITETHISGAEDKPVLEAQGLRARSNNIRRYSLVVMLVSYIWQIIIYFNGGVESFLVPLLMFIPGVIALIFRVKSKEGFRNVGWDPRKWRYILISLFIPLVCTMGLVILLQVSGFASLTVFLFSDGLITAKVPLILGNHPQNIWFFTLNLALSFIPISLIGGIFTLGEEFGWRGYLQEKMLIKYGLNRGLVLLGLLWGYWHLPIVLMGWSFPDHPVLGAFVLFPISTVFIGIYVGWIYLRSRSIWTPIITHAAWNTSTGIIFGGMVFNQNILVIQMIWMAMWGIIALACIISLNQNKPILWQEFAHSN